MSTKAKAKKAEVILDTEQTKIVRAYAVIGTKANDAWNGLTIYSQAFISSAVLFDGEWSDEAIENLNKALKAMQSKLDRKTAGYATFASAKSTILKAYRLGVADVRKPKGELDTECKAIAQAQAQANASESGDGESGDGGSTPTAGAETPQALIERALAMLIAQGDATPCQTLIKIAHGYVNKKQK